MPETQAFVEREYGIMFTPKHDQRGLTDRQWKRIQRSQLLLGMMHSAFRRALVRAGAHPDHIRFDEYFRLDRLRWEVYAWGIGFEAVASA